MIKVISSDADGVYILPLNQINSVIKPIKISGVFRGEVIEESI
jgi:hypothetical protein